MSVDQISRGLACTSIRVKASNNFATVLERDTYFSENPKELFDEMYCIANTVLYQYVNNAWKNVTPLWQGTKGDKGNPCTIEIGTVISGDTAMVNNGGTTTNAVFNFILPKGDKGETGETGMTGASGIVWKGAYDNSITYVPNDAIYSDGATYYCHTSILGIDPSTDLEQNYFHPLALMGASGQDGSDGVDATISIGTVITLEPDSDATVENGGTESTAILNFGIPKGDKGDTGDKGLNWKNSYNPDTTYNKNDAVYYSLKSYICILDGTVGITPNESASEWDLLVDNSGTFLPHTKTAIPYWGTIAELERGWQICDGSNNTPNLTSQFIRGASNDSEIGTTKGHTTALPSGGTKFKTESKGHSHVTQAQSETGDYTYTLVNDTNTLYNGTHYHGTTVNSTNGLSGSTYPINPIYSSRTVPYVSGVWNVDNGSNVEGSGDQYPKVNGTSSGIGYSNLLHAHTISTTNSPHRHRGQVPSLNVKESSVQLEVTLGGDLETAPQHILMYWITYTGELAPNW